MKANAEADSLQMANNINANLDTNSQDSSSSPTSEAAAGQLFFCKHRWRCSRFKIFLILFCLSIYFKILIDVLKVRFTK